jgi:hypothetical protein
VAAHADRLGSISVPTLLVRGELDEIASAEAQEELLRLIPDGRLVAYGGIGHAVHWEDPARPLRVRARRQRLTNDRACALTSAVRLPSAMFVSVRCRPHVGSGEGFGTGAPPRAVTSSTCAAPDVQCAR